MVTLTGCDVIMLWKIFVMPQLIGVLRNSDIENKSLTALLPRLTEALQIFKKKP
jgi:hypothetical protein